MLQTQTVAESTLGLLKQLLQIPELASFYLVGGTNLSLKYGHRLSVDLDLFTSEPFDSDQLRSVLEGIFPNMIVTLHNASAILCYIEEVKVDFVLYRYGMINPVEIHNELRFASVPDIIAMKLNAVSRRGAKKDYWDIAVLLETYSVEEMLQFYKQRHQTSDIGFIIRSMLYFEDANASEAPVSLRVNLTWDYVKTTIENAIRTYIQQQKK
jgi:Nucleotidyl transferase AbiEii toxin, Type IV TA system